jgi:hypothetical protein
MFQILNILSHVSTIEANPLALEDNDVRNFSTYKSKENSISSYKHTLSFHSFNITINVEKPNSSKSFMYRNGCAPRLGTLQNAPTGKLP